jgi:ankyrin repeat protein
MGSTDVEIARMGSTEGAGSNSPLMTLPNELFLDVASHLQSFEDLNSLVRTSRFFHGMFNTNLYRRAVAADHAVVLNKIVGWVLSRYRLASLTLLLDNGLSANYTAHFYLTPWKGTMLHFLCQRPDQKCSVPLARLLIQRGADTKATRALYTAINRGNYPIVALLLENGADPNAADNCGETQLCLASRRCDDRMVNLLIAHDADIEARDEDGNTPLILASQHIRNKRAMAALLGHGADAGVHNNRGETPLHYASCWLGGEDHELAKSLLEHGAIVNATDEDMHCIFRHLYFYRRNHPDDGLFMTKFLLENGADVNAISNDGLSLLQCALDRHDCGADVVALLLEHGADVSRLDGYERRLLQRLMNVTGE